MFISQKEAEERLKQSDNLLRRDPYASEDEMKESVKNPAPSPEPSQPEGAETPESDDEPATELLSGLDKLDDLIQPRTGRANYRMKREAQGAIAETATILGPTVAARTFGLSVSQAQGYADGLAGNQDKQHPIPVIRERVKLVKERIALSAARKLRTTLKCLTPEKLEAIENPLDAGRLAKDLATVVDKMEPKDKALDDRIQFHVYVPQVKKLEDYNVINVTPRKVETEAPV